MKKIIITSLVLSLFYSIAATAQVGEIFTSIDSEGNELCYKITSDNTVMLIRDQHERYKNVKSVAIPNKVDYQGKTYVVSELQPNCFFYCQSLVEISIPSPIKIIPDRFFDACYSLRKVSLPSTVTEFGKLAFTFCKSLRQIEIPLSVTKMGGGCFSFSGITSINIPNGVTSLLSDPEDTIMNGFFQGCSSLTDINLPSSVIELGPECFGGCTQLQKIVLPNKIESLPSGYKDYTGCFSHCYNLVEITLPANLKTIGKDCFQDCKKLKRVKGLHEGISLERHYYNNVSWGPFNSSSFNIDSVMNTFSYYALGLVKKEIDEWQKKRDFETTAQYQQRVTKEARDQKIAAIIEKAKSEYIANPKKKIGNIEVGTYDSDYGVLTLNVEVLEYNNDEHKYNRYGKKTTKYIKIPNSEIEKFKKKLNSQKVKSTYIKLNDNCVLADLEIPIGNKTYITEPISKDYLENDIAINLPDINIHEEETTKPSNSKSTIRDNHIDTNIPSVNNTNSSTFAIIIGNENYTQVAKVPYANNDAKIFAEYCKKTLGMPVQNVRVYENATFGTMLTAVNDVKQIADAYQGNVSIIFYYAGHGIPNETTKDAYLLPVDADGRQTEACYPVSRLYKELSEMGTKNVVVFMDACFSGAQRGEGMLASARGVAIKAKADAPQGNMVVFTAATGDETAYPYNEKGHGMFTYFLLKKIQETKGDCTLGELGEYILQNVRQQSVVINRKSQTPTVMPSASFAESWKTLKLK